MSLQITSIEDPFKDPRLARPAYWLMRTADAMGLLEGARIERLDLSAMERVLRSVGEAGVGMAAQASLALGERRLPGLAELLASLSRTLEESPAPDTEWKKLRGLLGDDLLADLMELSLSSIRRYESGQRATPDDVADRLHFLALVTGDLAGGYNDFGIRRWFVRKRERLGGKAPRELLRGMWSSDGAGPRRVRELARSLCGPGRV